MRKNKKGGLQDLIFIMGILLVTGIMFLFGFKFIDELNTNFQDMDILDTEGKEASQKLRDMYPNVMDNTFLLLLVGLMLAAIVFALLVAIHPIFFIFYILLSALVIFLGGVFSNIYQEMAATPQMTAIAAELTFTSHILTYLPIIIAVFGFVLAIVMYRTYQNSI